jgi:hypothetical protein
MQIWRNVSLALGAWSLFLAITTISMTGCGKSKDDSMDLSLLNATKTKYETYCVTGPTPTPAPGVYVNINNPHPDFDVPEELPQVEIPLAVKGCPALNGRKPEFMGKKMPGLIAVVDCNAKLVRFKTRDYQTSEASSIGPSGDFDIKLMYILRLTDDAEGTGNCWTRVLGHIQGNAQCPGDPAAARVFFTADWKFDETPPEIMEPPLPGHADLRNGKACKFKPGNCEFSNAANIGCDGY